MIAIDDTYFRNSCPQDGSAPLKSDRCISVLGLILGIGRKDWSKLTGCKERSINRVHFLWRAGLREHRWLPGCKYWEPSLGPTRGRPPSQYPMSFAMGLAYRYSPSQKSWSSILSTFSYHSTSLDHYRLVDAQCQSHWDPSPPVSQSFSMDQFDQVDDLSFHHLWEDTPQWTVYG